MTKFIETIELNKEGKIFTIDLKGKNLILVGNNGAGKTKFLSLLNTILRRFIISKNFLSREDIQKQLNNFQHELSLMKDTHPHRQISYEQHINDLNLQLALLKDCNVIYSSPNELKIRIARNTVVYRFFEAHRLFSQGGGNLLKSVDELYGYLNQISINEILTSSHFESYLVSLSNYALLEKGDGNIEEHDRISRIIAKIEQDLKSLFEDDTLRLVFNKKTLRMDITRDDNEPFNMQILPSGYASILAVYTELVMLSELGRKEKNEIQGIVLIDEIDAHLHVTVQKKVFDFFSTSFPGIQFIISTHSPFVVQSVSNAIIYNLSTHEQLEDLSAYSYTSIIKGLLGETSNSNELEKTLEDIDNLSRNSDFGVRFHELVTFLDGHFADLDPRAKAILMTAKSRLVDWEEGLDNV